MTYNLNNSRGYYQIYSEELSQLAEYPLMHEIVFNNTVFSMSVRFDTDRKAYQVCIQSELDNIIVYVSYMGILELHAMASGKLASIEARETYMPKMLRAKFAWAFGYNKKAVNDGTDVYYSDLKFQAYKDSLEEKVSLGEEKGIHVLSGGSKDLINADFFEYHNAYSSITSWRRNGIYMKGWPSKDDVMEYLKEVLKLSPDKWPGVFTDEYKMLRPSYLYKWLIYQDELKEERKAAQAAEGADEHIGIVRV